MEKKFLEVLGGSFKLPKKLEKIKLEKKDREEELERVIKIKKN